MAAAGGLNERVIEPEQVRLMPPARIEIHRVRRQRGDRRPLDFDIEGGGCFEKALDGKVGRLAEGHGEILIGLPVFAAHRNRAVLRGLPVKTEKRTERGEDLGPWRAIPCAAENQLAPGVALRRLDAGAHGTDHTGFAQGAKLGVWPEPE